MNKPVKYKTSLSLLQASGNEAIDELLHFLLPDVGFGLVTFEEDDFRHDNITYLLYHEIPTYVPVSVRVGESLKHALFMMASLNGHVRLKECGKSFVSETNPENTELVQFLTVLSTEMEIDKNGILLS